MEFHEGLEEQRNPYPQQAGMVEVKRDREGKQKEVRLGTGETKKKRMEFVTLWEEEKTQIQTRLIVFPS